MVDGYEWDDDKNTSNQQKHGLSFEEAIEIFNGPILTHGRIDESGEHRELSFGFLGGIVVAAVVHTDRQETTRIISARKATRSERRMFDAYLEKTLG